MIRNVQDNKIVVKNYNLEHKKDVKKTNSIEMQCGQKDTLDLNKTSSKNNTVYDRRSIKRADCKEINKLIAEAERTHDGLRELVAKMITKQGKNYSHNIFNKEIFSIDNQGTFETGGPVLEDNEWGIEAVSDRLFAFAKAISGGDKTKLAELKDGITRGFKEAEKILGGQLPEISHKTLDETMRKLDDWANNHGD